MTTEIKVLLVAEHNHHQLSAHMPKLVSAALLLGGELKSVSLTVLVAGHHCEQVAKQASELEGVNQVWLSNDAVYGELLAENLAELVASIAEGFTHVIAASSTFSKDLMPRAAALLDVGQISDVMEIVDSKTFVRPIYAGNALAKVKSLAERTVMTVRTTAFSPCGKQQASSVEILNTLHSICYTEALGVQVNQSDRPELTVAKVVIAGGRGLGSKEKFNLVNQLADKLGAAVGASRAAVDAGYISNEYQVGQTGKIVSPELYIAVGISGAIQHLAGMKESGIIVAINSDPDAPIIDIADYGLVGDLFEIVPELIDKI